MRKDAPRVEAYGAIDELNAILGIVLTLVEDDDMREGLLQIQEDLFVIGADLATPDTDGASKAAAWVPRLQATHVTQLERWIDDVQAELPPTNTFILPGGVPSAAHLHHARTVCRRAERRLIALEEAEPITEHVRNYLNRLSDLLFVWARLANHRAGIEDRPWKVSRRE